MSKPRQPEVHRSGKGATDPASAKANPEGEGNPGAEGAAGPIPEDNLPGHRPDKEQDKPVVPK